MEPTLFSNSKEQTEHPRHQVAPVSINTSQMTMAPDKESKPGETWDLLSCTDEHYRQQGVTVDLPKFTLVILTMAIQGDTTGLLDTKC